ncbi:baseplate J/gp47 family protein [Gudongella oleilytica]|uniref:baseplate J/gp47 family protein n=1 Tax=Gudongella oleilytica TaxID=1582259 RepID=UPI002A36F663|nr:baseplate J/gp47 family protein [Gudongella oleilytica]MDY0256260.1 baseplate J/gp47 family protein [Gudongella oleilytica]
MFENMTFENIMDRCLARVSDSVDKREGSVIYDAIAPAAAELAILYIELGTIMDRAFPDTATDVDLTKKAQERGVFRQAATYAVRKGYFENAQGAGYELAIGTRFSGGDINYRVTERITAGQYKLTAETAGAVGNEYFGTLFPIDFVDGLAAATLADVLIPGEDEESDDSLRERYFATLKSQAFGGNIADYRNKVELLQGVGAAKVIPVWNGGGTVKIVLLDSEWGVPSPELVASVQADVDPVGSQGEGVGIAPIGHIVTVTAVTGVTIDVSFTLTFASGVTWASVQQAVCDAIQSYFVELAKVWADSSNLVVRVSQIETKILNVEGVIDITGTTINGGTANISLDATSIPVLGVVTNGAS